MMGKAFSSFFRFPNRASFIFFVFLCGHQQNKTGPPVLPHNTICENYYLEISEVPQDSQKIIKLLNLFVYPQQKIGWAYRMVYFSLFQERRQRLAFHLCTRSLSFFRLFSAESSANFGIRPNGNKRRH